LQNRGCLERFAPMFTGIIETIGIVSDIELKTSSNKSFWIKSNLSSELKVDQSVSHNGVCLTIEEIKDDRHRVTAIAETLKKTTIKNWKAGEKINLERSLLFNSRVDGHFVQGHVDTVAKCVTIENKNGSTEYEFEVSKKFGGFIIEKGSIAVNGISLTAFDVTKRSFRVAIIPYTYEHTNMHCVKKKDEVNLEFDMLGKYILRKLSLIK